MTSSRSAMKLVSSDGLLEQCLDGAALALQHLDQRGGELVDVLGLEHLEERPEPVQQLGQVEARVGAVERDRGVVIGASLPRSSPWTRARYRWPRRFW